MRGSYESMNAGFEKTKQIFLWKNYLFHSTNSSLQLVKAVDQAIQVWKKTQKVQLKKSHEPNSEGVWEIKAKKKNIKTFENNI